MPPAEQPAETIPFPPVSVVIVSRNRLEELRRCLRAVEASNHAKGIEIVVVDAGSRDGSAQVDLEFPWVRLVKMPRNFGKTRARNIGVRTATGELILFLDPAVEVAPPAISLLAQALAGRPDAAAAAPLVEDPAGEPVTASYKLPGVAELATACLEGGLFPPAEAGETAEAVWDGALLVRKTFIAGMNYFDEKRFFEYFAELDLFRQIKNAGRKVLLVREAKVVAHPPGAAPFDLDSRALVACDRVAGAATYLAKLAGSGASISFRTKMLLGVFAAMLRMRDAGYHRRVLTGLLSGLRIDGTQSGPLG